MQSTKSFFDLSVRGLLCLAFVACSAGSTKDGGPRRTTSDSPPLDPGGFPSDSYDAGSIFDVPPPAGPKPPVPVDYGNEVREADPTPPPISGGTLIVARDGRTLVAADPDRDRVWIVDGAAQKVLGVVVLRPGDEPGRLVEDAAGLVHVALRRGGAIVTIDPKTLVISARRTVCSTPRGIAYDAAIDRLHVACASGEVITIEPLAPTPTRVIQLGRDLRDIVAADGRLYVSIFRSAIVLSLFSDGSPMTARRMPPVKDFHGAVAWRMIPRLGGGVFVLHQRARVQLVKNFGDEYCDGCGVVHSAVTALPTEGVAPVGGPSIDGAVLAVDLAVSPRSAEIAVVAPGNRGILAPQLIVTKIDDLAKPPSCVGAKSKAMMIKQPYQLTSVAYMPEGQLVVQSREPAALLIDGKVIVLPGESALDTGHAIFHSSTGDRIACASCHVEGGDDGRVWQFWDSSTFDGRPARTQNLRGGLLITAPFHWRGDLETFGGVVQETFMTKMHGPPLTAQQLGAFARWVDRIPLLPTPKPRDPDAVERGRLLFKGPAQGCMTCHSGPSFTGNGTIDVGTGGELQIPSLLGVGWRAPYMHNGCAISLRDRFGPCGGTKHGHTSHLSEASIQDLIAYLESL